MVFQDLHVVGLGALASYQPTLGSVLNPLHIVDTVQRIRHPPTRDILIGFEGVVRPGEMLCKYYEGTINERYFTGLGL